MILSHFEGTQGFSLQHSLTMRPSSQKGLQDWLNFFPETGPISPFSEHIPALGLLPADVLHCPYPIRD